MDNQLNRNSNYFAKRSKDNSLGTSAPSSTTCTKSFRQRTEDVNDHPRSARVHYPNLQVLIFNWFDKLSAMIHIQIYSWGFSLLWYNRRNYPQLSQVTSRGVPHQQRVKLYCENLAKFHDGFCRLCDMIRDDET